MTPMKRFVTSFVTALLVTVLPFLFLASATKGTTGERVGQRLVDIFTAPGGAIAKALAPIHSLAFPIIWIIANTAIYGLIIFMIISLIAKHPERAEPKHGSGPAVH